MPINVQHSIIAGRLTAKPEIKMTTSGKSVCPFTIAVNIGTGDNRYTEFNECVAYGKLAETIARYFDKGSEILVTCQRGWRTRTWDDRNGNKRYKTEHEVTDFCFVGAKGSEAQKSPTNTPYVPDAYLPTQGAESTAGGKYASPAPNFDDAAGDDNLPF